MWPRTLSSSSMAVSNWVISYELSLGILIDQLDHRGRKHVHIIVLCTCHSTRSTVRSN